MDQQSTTLPCAPGGSELAILRSHCENICPVLPRVTGERPQQEPGRGLLAIVREPEGGPVSANVPQGVVALFLEMEHGDSF